MILNDWLHRILNWAQFNGALIKSSPQFVVWDFFLCFLTFSCMCLFLSICPSQFFSSFLSFFFFLLFIHFDDCSIKDFILACCIVQAWNLIYRWKICDVHGRILFYYFIEINFLGFGVRRQLQKTVNLDELFDALSTDY